MTMLTAVNVMAMECGTPPSTEGMDTSRKTGPGYLKWPAEARGCQGFDRWSELSKGGVCVLGKDWMVGRCYSISGYFRKASCREVMNQHLADCMQ